MGYYVKASPKWGTKIMILQYLSKQKENFLLSPESEVS